jgi:hypothetical protein
MIIQIDSISAISKVSKDSISSINTIRKEQISKNLNNQIIKEKSTPLTTNYKIVKVGFEPDSVPFTTCYYTEPWTEILNTQNLVSSAFLYKKPALVVDKSEIPRTSLGIENNRVQRNSFGSIMDNLILALIIFSFILLAWTKVFFGKYVTQILRATFNYSESFKLFRDHNSIVERFYWLLNIIFTISGGIFIFHLLKIINPSIFSSSNFYIILGCFVIIILYYFIRFLINKIVGFLLNQQQVFNEFIHSYFIYLKVMGLALLPLVTIISFVSVNYRLIFLILGTIIIFLLYIISIFRATRIMIKKGILIFYWILYLCTIEFLPIMLLYKFISSIV